METSLFFKTFVVFGTQLSLVFGICYYFIYSARKATLAGERFFGSLFEIKYNKNGELDLFSKEEEEYDEWVFKEETKLNALFYKDKLAYDKQKKKFDLEKEQKSTPLRRLTYYLSFIWMVSLFSTAFISFSDYSIFFKML